MISLISLQVTSLKLLLLADYLTILLRNQTEYKKQKEKRKKEKQNGLR